MITPMVSAKAKSVSVGLPNIRSLAEAARDIRRC